MVEETSVRASYIFSVLSMTVPSLPISRTPQEIVTSEWHEEMNEIVFVVEEAPEGGYTAHALGQSIVTEADTIPELRTMVQDAVRCHFDEGSTPQVIRLHFVREEVLAS